MLGVAVGEWADSGSLLAELPAHREFKAILKKPGVSSPGLGHSVGSL